MTGPAYLHQENFRHILTRNIALPLGVGALSAAVFVGLIFYLLSALGGVEQTERAISNANQIGKLGADMETSMYGYLVTGEESLLQPYQIGKPRIAAETASLTELVKGNREQVSRLRRIGALQSQWNEFAQTIVDLRRKDLNYQEPVRSAGGRSLTNEIRREFSEFIGIEERLLQQRNDQARSTTFWGMAAYLLFNLGLSGLLALDRPPRTDAPVRYLWRGGAAASRHGTAAGAAALAAHRTAATRRAHHWPSRQWSR